ncbi:gliding motility-associated C-terminal domain-containing protein [Chryseolinea sp. T2]|uniref:T9SS type B sorting domain-containing protein n=1 Tax=Chryseolinea sp. T2 TaxID=3129255 RepID=UPI0030772613
MLRIIIMFALCMASLGVLAQPYVSDKGRFQVDQISGCAPFTVNVTIIPPYACNGATPCDMDYEFPVLIDFEQNDFDHTYLQPGTYTLRILFQTQGFDQITINVLPNIQPAIQVFKCSSNGIQLTIPDNNYDEYVVDYNNDGTPEQVVPKNVSAKYSYTYPSAGSKILSVHGRNIGAADNCNKTLFPIAASGSLATPTISQLQVTDASTIRLDFANIEQNVLYKLEVATNAGTFQPYRDVYNSSMQTITGLNVNSNYYCFRLGAFDPCSNSVIAYSNIICSADFDATAINGANRLIWRTNSTGVSAYNFSRNPSGTTAISATPPQTSLDDTDVLCNEEYCYQLTTVYTNGSRSISLESCATAFTSQQPATPQNISIQITGTTSLDLQWSQDILYKPAEYTVFKNNVEFGKTKDQIISDNAFLVNAPECYAVSYVDECGNKSTLSAAACPLILTAVLQDDNSVVLSWNAYAGWVNGVDHYTVERYDEDGQLLTSVDAGNALTITDSDPDPNNQVIAYRILATAVDGTVVESISNQVVIIKQPNIYHPNTFTPNNDGLNDTFKVMSQYTETVEFMVFNRWGEMLFYTTDLTVAWDGTYKGDAVPEGTYTFRAFLTDMAGVKYEKSGNVVVLRKR